MYYEDPENYYEPSEVDMLLNEYQDKMKEVLLESVKSEIDSIKNENTYLKEEVKKLRSREIEVENKARDLDYQKTNLLQQVKKERLSKLLEDFKVVMYKVVLTKERLPKCSKCNDQRKLEYISPLGNKMYETCTCDYGKNVYKPEEYMCIEFRLDRHNGNKIMMWFQENNNEDYEYYRYDGSTYAKTIYKEDMKYEDLSAWDTFFKTKEECQKYCDWHNSKVKNESSSNNHGKKINRFK